MRELWAPLTYPKLEDRVAIVEIDGRVWRIPASAMSSRTFRFVIPSDTPGRFVYHADLGLPAVLHATPGTIPVEIRRGGAVDRLAPVQALPAVILDDGTNVALEPVGDVTGPLAGASLHTEKPKEPYRADPPATH